MNKPLPASIQGLSAILRKAGHERSTSETTRVRGWHSITAGYGLKKAPDFLNGYVARLQYQPSRHDRNPSETCAAKLKVFRELLEGMGYKIETGGFSGPDPQLDHTLWISLP